MNDPLHTGYARKKNNIVILGDEFQIFHFLRVFVCLCVFTFCLFVCLFCFCIACYYLSEGFKVLFLEP